MNRKRIWTSIFLVMYMIVFFFSRPMTVTVSAASIANSKPTIKKAQYLYNCVNLEWTKVTGAKSYQIQRREMNPKTGKWGKYKLWKTTTRTSVMKQATGDCQYRVRAVKGKTYGRWSSPKRVFAASAKIIDRSYEAAGYLTIKIKIANHTKSPMGLIKGYIDEKRMSQIRFYNKGKLIETYHGDLYSGSIWTDDNYMSTEIPANKTKIIYLRTNISTLVWWNYPMFGEPTDLQNKKMKIITPFYPNPNKENTKLTVSYTKNVQNSVTK